MLKTAILKLKDTLFCNKLNPSSFSLILWKYHAQYVFLKKRSIYLPIFLRLTKIEL